MKHIAVVGLGKVGSLVATLLNDMFTVTGIDQKAPADVPFKIATGNITDAKFLEELLSKQDAVVSCLPYNLNLPVAEAAFKTGIHYFDLTEDVPTTSAIRKMAETSKGVMAAAVRTGAWVYRYCWRRPVSPVYQIARCGAAGRRTAPLSQWVDGIFIHLVACRCDQ